MHNWCHVNRTPPEARPGRSSPVRFSTIDQGYAEPPPSLTPLPAILDFKTLASALYTSNLFNNLIIRYHIYHLPYIHSHRLSPSTLNKPNQTIPSRAMPDPSAELQSTLRDLAIGTKPVQDIPRPIPSKPSTKSAPKPKKPSAKPVADSWEDEANLSSDDEPASTSNLTSPSVLSPTGSAEGPLDPPPTPISPQTSYPWAAAGSASPAAGQNNSGRRPEKQTAVAGRLIAGALGIRAPKRTEEQRAYDRSVKEQEIRRRNREREELAKAKEEEERAKASVWTD